MNKSQLQAPPKCRAQRVYIPQSVHHQIILHQEAEHLRTTSEAYYDILRAGMKALGLMPRTRP